MTIIESIKEVLCSNEQGLSAAEIYTQIIDKKLYQFRAKNPISVVNGEIRRHCDGLDFPTASPIKHFKISGFDGKKTRYSLLGNSSGTMPKATKDNNLAKESSEYLPEEKIAKAIDEHIQQIKTQLLENIMNNDPNFFEHLVVDLLLKMGYGYDKKSGIVTGGSHDGGVEGIISEDKLGLDLIYLQAKRYASNNKVGRKELQAFIGAMGSVQKGVFITTSSFTKEASSFGVQQQQKSIKLIDGDMLAEYMVKYQIGVESVKEFYIFRIDTDYFTY